MKKSSFLLFIILAIFWSCGNDDDLVNCSTTYDILTSKTWIPVDDDDIFASMLFSTDGFYYENGLNSGQWELDSDCKNINFIGNTLKYEISEITPNMLVIFSPFGAITFN